MKSAKTVVFEFVQKEIFSNPQYKNGMDTKSIADALGLQRSNVSALLNELCKEGKLSKTNTRPVMYTVENSLNKVAEESCFERLIGCKDSLKNPIQLAKAAVLYPKRSLNILLCGPRGSGVTRFAQAIHQYAVETKVIAQDAPYHRLNSLHYSKNISSLNDDLFGIDNDLSTGLFVKAKGGVLFLDNFDLLDGKQQSRIFHFLETGYIMNDIGTESIDCSDTFLIVSCQARNVDAFNRRFPIVIDIPSMQNRSMSEKFNLVNYFFSNEANRAERNIEVSREAIEALLIHEYEYNVREMEQEIKATCASAYVRVIHSPDHNVTIGIHDFNPIFQRDLLQLRKYSKQLNEIIGFEDVIVYDKNLGYKEVTQTENVYNVIRNQFDELSSRGLNPDLIDSTINAHVNSLFVSYKYRYSENDEYNLEQLSKIVDKRIINLVDLFLKEIQQKFNRNLKKNIFYGLCLHINSLMDKKFDYKRIDDEQLTKTIQNYPSEYASCTAFSNLLKEHLGLELPMDEVVIMTMFIVEQKQEEKVHPVVLYVLHGERTAHSLAETTNILTQSNNAYGFDIRLDVDTTESYKQLKELVLQIDNGGGIIMIYDMGSIKSMIEMLQEETNVKIRSVNIPITLVGIDIARRCAMETDIEYVYHTVSQEMAQSQHVTMNRNAIITLCHTGEGGATQLKSYIDQYSHLGLYTVALSISDRDELLKEVTSIKKNYNIQAFVGTYDPKLLGIPFIPISKIFENKKEVLDKILTFEPVNTETFDNFDAVYSYLEETLEYTQVSKLKTVLPGVIDELSMKYDLNTDQQTGLFMHLACVVERVLDNQPTTKLRDSNHILDAFEDDYKFIRKSMKKLESTFKIIIDDNEVATIISIIKEL